MKRAVGFCLKSLKGQQAWFSSLTAYPFAKPPTNLDPVPFKVTSQTANWVGLIRNHNSSIYLEPRQVLVGTIVHVDVKHVLLDLGWKEMLTILKCELNTMEMIGFSDPSQRKHAQDFRQGDKFKFFVDVIQSPFGFMHVYPIKQDTKVNQEMVWDEMKKAKINGTQIMGRVLNAVSGGYAIGVGGIVGFCAYNKISKEAVQKIGKRWTFQVETIDLKRKQLTLIDPTIVRKQKIQS
eukprot:TRINITY_DN18914_c1_g2_i1.p1 TRINITY_DN18914_c1_g2~~TRINITY_DN18914_c1_g2_i1.p1  ORF type:complete len:243 (+),score=10.61 TRINITY_DN18914_c1_g2_i1:22-729(+)